MKIEDLGRRLAAAASDLSDTIKLKQNVSIEEVARVEARKVDFPGLQVDVVVSREYLYWQNASHVIGYLGRLSLKQAKDPRYSHIPREEFIGQWGAEKIYDTVLRGTAGEKIVEIDAMGRVVKSVGSEPFVKGRDIELTIDMTLQSVAEDELFDKTGAVVALDPNSGEILVLASNPSFDPNLFARGINFEDWEDIVNDPLHPLMNRALQSQYPPGSTFKIITTLAALEEGAVTKDTQFVCTGSINIGRTFGCWKKGGHGRVDLHRAIVESCDVYFYEAGKRLGVDPIARSALDFGLGRTTGIELDGEKPGLVPSTGWKLKTKKEKWYLGETLNTAIGQGYLSVTPLQMARLMAAVVNGGKLYRPHILKDPTVENIIDRKLNIKPENMEFLRKALVDVVTSGTGRAAHSNLITIGGKTGTAQAIGGDKASAKYRDHAWFVSFAPEEDPQIVVAVLVEHGGHGGSAAAPIAKSVIEAFYQERTQPKNEDAEDDLPVESINGLKSGLEDAPSQDPGVSSLLPLLGYSSKQENRENNSGSIVEH
ncbi:MAG: penicillin-binding protein 2 [Nitrospirae bacterium]|nr:penicillin-binding protein 2 [Nitrospirota bacterium]